MKIKDTALNVLRNIDDFIYERVGPIRILFVTSDSYGFSCQAPVITALKTKGNVLVRATAIDSGPDFGAGLLDAEERNLFNECRIATKRAALVKWHITVY